MYYFAIVSWLVKGLKFRIEMGNVSKRQQPNQRSENNRRPPMNLQQDGKTRYPEAGFSWSLDQNVY